MDLIKAPSEVYIGKILILIEIPNLYMCSIQMSSKYVWGVGLPASSSESRHVMLIQSRVQEGDQKGGGGGK